MPPKRVTPTLVAPLASSAPMVSSIPDIGRGGSSHKRIEEMIKKYESLSKKGKKKKSGAPKQKKPALKVSDYVVKKRAPKQYYKSSIGLKQDLKEIAKCMSIPIGKKSRRGLLEEIKTNIHRNIGERKYSRWSKGSKGESMKPLDKELYEEGLLD